ncbi:hypothetical protein DS901_09045 [Loktanella sp. D2R18]|uniref:hypothetical protein n=1 Tax=Rhodobacterales TaxID=204455 RepID=UPI000DEBCB04|nr:MULTISPECIES: hypothetical protein [Rhodobacterales]MDO6591498.1 hypothetical protein [Yoonia sp. 1_MG-2023]RBW43867.1 hypothetical protein DS901_09045 [Loktanella sp. D2R18]
MSWAQFKNILMKLNIGVAGTIWLGFWGYGAWVGEMPPVSTVPGLLAGTVAVGMMVSVAFFLISHVSLFLRAKTSSECLRGSQANQRALWIGVAGIGVLISLGFAQNIGDAILVPMAILGSLMAIYGLIYAFIGFGSQFFQWQFTAKN